MSLLWGRRAVGDSLDNLVPARVSTTGRTFTPDQAMKHSAAWACVRLRAGLVSSLPLDVYRVQNGLQVPVAPPAVLRKPGALLVGGSTVQAWEWLYATQTDLDRVGNAFGLIVARDAMQRPSRIDLLDASTVTVQSRDGVLSYRVNGKDYAPGEIWHERQYVVPGLAVGLSPIAHAAWSMSGYFSAQQFAAEWFSSGAAPAGHLKNVNKTLNAEQADTVKARFKASISNGDVYVSGSDWEYSALGVDSKQSEFISAQEFSVADVCRFFDVPGDVIDAASGKSNITYANVTQRFLQLLVLHLGPTINRREAALQDLTPGPHQVRFNRDALLAMDPKTRAEVFAAQVGARYKTPDEVRALENLPPLTHEQIMLFNRLWNRMWRFSDKNGTGDLAEDLSIEENL